MNEECLTGWTTIEQSKKLVEAGLNPDTADMYYSAYITYANGNPIKGGPTYGLQAWPYKDRSSMVVGFTKVDYVPCWTVGKLIDLMPKSLNWNSLIIIGNQVLYASVEEWAYNGKTMNEFCKNTLIDSVISMVIWLLENNYINKEEQNV
jgi:hypothetical protein